MTTGRLGDVLLLQEPVRGSAARLRLNLAARALM